MAVKTERLPSLWKGAVPKLLIRSLTHALGLQSSRSVWRILTVIWLNHYHHQSSSHYCGFIFYCSNSGVRPPLQLPDAPTRRWVKRPGDLDLLTLKVVAESRVTWATSVPILVFLRLSVLDLGPTYVTDRQTSDVHHRLMLPPIRGGGIIKAD